jgi:hypothetical protein
MIKSSSLTRFCAGGDIAALMHLMFSRLPSAIKRSATAGRGQWDWFHMASVYKGVLRLTIGFVSQRLGGM